MNASDCHISIVTREEELPRGLREDNFFHSPQLFRLCKQTPRHKPYMVVAQDDEGRVVGQMLATVRYRSSWFPPYFYMHCRVMGEGAYDEGLDQRDLLTGRMLERLTGQLEHRVLYIEVSHLSHKMTAYRQLRQAGYFPVRWMSIHNSLHSRTPEERISQRMQQRIDRAYARGVETREVTTDDDFREHMRLLRKHNWLKPRRFVPADEFFRGLVSEQCGRLFVTRQREHVIGCSTCVYSGGDAYLWYAAYRRKSYARLHPDVLTIWHAIKDAHQRGYQHIRFMDVGLPYRKNPFREFILRFGGKPVSTYRWFHCGIGWVNWLLSRIYRD